MSYMPLYPISRFAAVAAYLLIFLYGELIQAPFILWIIVGFFAGDLLFILAGTSLIALAVLMVVQQRKATVMVECYAFIFMLLPIIHSFSNAPTHLLRYNKFIIPASIFIILFPLSIVLSYQKHRRGLQKSIMAMENEINN